MNLLFLLTSLAMAADEPCPSDLASLYADLVQAEVAFSAEDEQGFHEAFERSRTRIGCLEEALTPTLAAAFHRTVAYDAFLGGNHPLAQRALRASQDLQPGLSLQLDNPLIQGIYEQARTLVVETEPLVPPEGLTIEVNGYDSTVRPTTLPFTLQVFEQDRVVWSGWVPDQGMLPDIIGAAAPGDVQSPEVVPGWRRPVAVATGTTTLLAGVGAISLGIAWRKNYADGEKALVDTLGNGTWITAVTAVAFGATTIIIRPKKQGGHP